ncbi:high mobility group protein 20A-like [Oncorhynchus tshawytscha]|uniref:high mobility group protein 20A-like n=1 Tax=Oncorhynchus tshawytscha TaxID=74940 RepID=UPI000D0A68E9|nr:high mobility group protein 20A-like [Oncorhynchus tshawytscha]
MLGLQWSQLGPNDKQKKNQEAEKDKQHDITGLTDYQNTEAYKDFLRKKALSRGPKLCGPQGADTEMEEETMAPDPIDSNLTAPLSTQAILTFTLTRDGHL